MRPILAHPTYQLVVRRSCEACAPPLLQCARPPVSCEAYISLQSYLEGQLWYCNNSSHMRQQARSTLSPACRVVLPARSYRYVFPGKGSNLHLYSIFCYSSEGAGDEASTPPVWNPPCFPQKEAGFPLAFHVGRACRSFHHGQSRLRPLVHTMCPSTCLAHCQASAPAALVEGRVTWGQNPYMNIVINGYCYPAGSCLGQMGSRVLTLHVTYGTVLRHVCKSEQGKARLGGELGTRLAAVQVPSGTLVPVAGGTCDSTDRSCGHMLSPEQGGWVPLPAPPASAPAPTAPSVTHA